MRIHIVQKGDTLWKIAQKYGVDFEQLKSMNAHISNPDAIMPGMKIKVPTSGGQVKKEEQKKQANVNIFPKKEAPKQQPQSYAETPEANTNYSKPENVKPEQKTPIAPSAKDEVKAPSLETPKTETDASSMPTSPTAQGGDKKKETQQPQGDLQKAVNVSPLTNTIPPFTPHGNMFNPSGMIPTMPQKPSNILPDIMKNENDFESPSDENEMEKPDANYQPQMPQMPQISQYMPQTPYVPQAPNMPQVPYIPQTPYQQPQPYMPVSPMTAGYGGNYPAPMGYQPMQPYQQENVNEPIEDESPDYSPELPNLPPNLGAPGVNEQAPVESNVPPMPQPMPQPMPTAALPYGNCIPVTPVMPGYGFCPPLQQWPAPVGTTHYGYPVTQPYSYPTQTAPSTYSPMPQPYVLPTPGPSGSLLGQQAGAVQPNMPMYPPAHPYSQRPPYNPFSMVPEYEESSEYEN